MIKGSCETTLGFFIYFCNVLILETITIGDMHGLFVTYGEKPTASFNLQFFDDKFLKREFSVGRLMVRQVTLRKFEREKLFIQNDHFFIAIEGLVLNFDELRKKYAVPDDESLVEALFKKNGPTFFSEMRGTFCGIFYLIQEEKLYVFEDHIGSQLLFYHQTEKTFFLASDLNILCDALKKCGVSLSYRKDAFYESLNGAGYVQPGFTYLNEVCRLNAGEYLYEADGKMEVSRYHRFMNVPNSYSEEEAIEGLDSHFKNAVRRIIHINKEYGYENYLSLSAGLDSRTVNFAEKSLTKDSAVNVTYSQSGFYDEKVPEEIAKYLGNQWHFEKLDGGPFVYEDFDNSLSVNFGLVYYSSVALVLHGLSSIEKDAVGCMATGNFGGEIMGYSTDSLGTISSYGEPWLLRLKHLFGKENYPNHELKYLYDELFPTGMGLFYTVSTFAYAYSPFIDVDFLNFALSIPKYNRCNYKIYDKWVQKCYPDATHWLHNGMKIGAKPFCLEFKGRSIPIKDVPMRIGRYLLKNLVSKKYGVKVTKSISMNPYDSWYEENPKVQAFVDGYLKENLPLLDGFEDEKLKQKALAMSEGSMLEKMRVMTLLGSIKRLNVCF